MPPNELPADNIAIALALCSRLDFVVAKYLNSGVLPNFFVEFRVEIKFLNPIQDPLWI